MDKKLKQIQQGDVLLQEVEIMPGDAIKSQAGGRLVLAVGEKTGHSHTIISEKANLWTVKEDDQTVNYLEVLEPVTIVHDEHKALPIPKGIYRIGHVKEFDYFSQMERRVID